MVKLNNTIFCLLAVATSLFLVGNYASAETAPSNPATFNAMSQRTTSRKNEILDLSKLNRENTELVEAGVFSTHSLFPQPVVEIVPEIATAPPLPFVFLGRIKQDGMETIFLAIDQRSFSVKPNDILDGTYLVNSIEQDKIVFTYLPLKTQQALNISHGE